MTTRHGTDAVNHSEGPFFEQPHVVLDAGGDGGAALSAALYRCIDEMASGQILHVITQDVGSRAEVPRWCFFTGHDLLDARYRGRETLFWIKKQ